MNPGNFKAAQELTDSARDAAAKAYCPYSHYPVGAALRTPDGRVFTGCNVENASYGLTLCAERSAVVSAVAAGARQFSALALVGGETQPATPCGACLQVLLEFCDPDMPVHCSTLGAADAPVLTLTLRELLPHAFQLKF